MKHEHISPPRRFERLSWLRDWAVDKHQVDPRGWHIVNVERRAIGEVKDLIVDTERMVGAFLDVQLDRKLFHLRDDAPRIFIPISRAHRDGDHKRLLVDGMTTARVAELYAARMAYECEFWNQWWDVHSAGNSGGAWAPRIAGGPTTTEDLQRALEQVGPGETVRIPIVNEEIVVERRPLSEDAVAKK
jgi:hypothetical protein